MGRSGELRAIQPDQQDLIVGQAARGPIPAGTVLNTDLFADQGAGDPGGAGGGRRCARRPGRRRRRAGAQATGWTCSGSCRRPAAATGAVAASRDGARVGHGVVGRAAASGGGRRQVWVSLLVPEASQAAVAQAAADGLLRLSLVGARMIVTLASVRGSPGVTSWALLLAAAWPAAFDVRAGGAGGGPRRRGAGRSLRAGRRAGCGVADRRAAPQRRLDGAGRGARPASRRRAVAGARAGVGRAGPARCGRGTRSRRGRGSPPTSGCGWSTPAGCDGESVTLPLVAAFAR